MWRTVIVNHGEKIIIRNNWLVVYSDDSEHRVPVDDIYALVIDNRSALLSVSVVSTLTQAGAHIYFCNEKHIPVSVAFPLNNHYKPLSVFNNQLAMTEDFKNELWSRIIRAKIGNQAECLKIAGIEHGKVESVSELCGNVLPGDSSNREAVAARKYFKLLFGSTFKRSDEDITNAALDYGYSIIRSSFCKTLTVYGFNCVLGIHHVNQNDPFNLAEDIMEPLRPLVDLWTDENCTELFEELTKENRRGLINLVNVPVLIDGKKMRVRYAIDKYVRSLVSAINENDTELIQIPELIPLDEFFEDDD